MHNQKTYYIPQTSMINIYERVGILKSKALITESFAFYQNHVEYSTMALNQR